MAKKSIEIKVEGIKEVQKMLNLSTKEIAERTDKGVLKGAIYLKSKVQEAIQGHGAPAGVDTGRFLNSVYARKEGDGQAVVASDIEYSRYLEYGCFFNEKSTKILTKRGYTILQNVRVGDEVYTHKGNWKKVMKKVLFYVDHQIPRYKIITKKGSRIVITENHPVYTNVGWKRADELKIGDNIITVHNDLPHFHWKNFSDKKKRIPYNRRKIMSERVEIKCLKCNNIFEVTKNSLKYRNPKYCSLNCYKSRINKFFIKCKTCSKEFEVTKNDIEKYNRQYCSNKCYTRSGESNANYGKRHPNLHDNLEYKEKMRKRMKGQNNPMFNKRVPNLWIGYRDDLGHLCKSTWEANYARILKELEIRYKYEPKSFELSNGTTYTPDFYIKDYNYYVEVKGYLTQKFKDKFELFKKDYPNIRITLIDQNEYKLLEKQWKDKIFWESGVTLRGSNLKFINDEITDIKRTHYKNCNIYNLSVEEDESFVANHIVTHNTSAHFIAPTNAKALHWKGGFTNYFSKGHDVSGIKARRYFGNTATREGENVKNIILEEIKKGKK